MKLIQINNCQSNELEEEANGFFSKKKQKGIKIKGNKKI